MAKDLRRLKEVQSQAEHNSGFWKKGLKINDSDRQEPIVCARKCLIRSTCYPAIT